jgi:hypothetical protein
MLPINSKQAIVRPLLKKSMLDPNDPNSYRPILKLSFVSKIVKKVVDMRLSNHMSRYNLLHLFQSAYRQFHSIEMALISIVINMIQDVTQRRFGVCGSALDWLVDFLMDRMQVVRAGGCESTVMNLKYGVPQGSVLGPKRFIKYAEDVT